MHEAFLFGSSAHQIFGSYHPATGVERGELVVICPPLFSEYMRTHLALRELSITLAERGQHVLRFDYRGTGDSSGELADVTPSDWIEDIRAAVREGCELTGVEQVRVVGVRVGGLLAHSACQPLSHVQQLVLWDPVSSGAAFLESLQRTQAEMLRRNRALDASVREAIREHFGGVALSPKMVAGLRSLRIDDANGSERSVHVVQTSPHAVPIARSIRHLERFDCNWEMDGEDLMMPQPVLERLSICLSEA